MATPGPITPRTPHSGASGERAPAVLAPYVPRLLVEWLRETPHERSKELDGSLAYVDISGFTALTERLARRGKVGAEEMTEHLNRLFSDLIPLGEAEGADLLKWGGDAVFLWFTGEEHASRACRTAFAMHAKIAKVGKLRTSVGTAVLRMSVGIHSGRFDFFLVGDVHRELLIAGPGASATATMESIAEAGEVAVSRATAALLPPEILAGERGPAVLVAAAPDARPRPAAPGKDAEGLDLSAVLPVALRSYLFAETHEPEHRQATIAFVEFRRVDELLERRSPEALAAALDACMRAVQRAALTYHVTFHETDIGGDDAVRALLVAGAPTSAGDDEERMLRAARAIVESEPPLPVRIGVNSGRIFTGDFGPPSRRTYSIKGDAVNLAARVTAKAAEGQILATEAVVARSQTVFALEPLEPFAVKGKTAPVHALAIGAVRRRRAAVAAAPRFVGRERELGRLLEALDSAQRYEGRLVEVVGEAGIGKSRLLDELVARAADVDALRCASEQYESATPYFPFRSLLREALDLPEQAGSVAAAERLTEVVAEVAPQLIPWLPLLAIPLEADVAPTAEVEELDERFRKVRLGEATRELLGLLFPRPTLFVFEDAHWMDEASRELLTVLAEGVELRPWLIVVARRPVEGGFRAPERASATTVELDPLDAEAAVVLVEAATDDAPLPPHQVAALANRSGGNPLFLTELAAAARAAGGIGGLPDSIEGLLTTQIDRLSPDDRTVLRHAAVLGGTFSVDLLDAALERRDASLDPELWERLGDFVERDDGAVRFRHALIRDVAYEGLPYRLRRELHGRAGETIERISGSGETASVLSLHFFHAQRYDKAWRYARAAGERASAIYANAEAAALYERALEASRRSRTSSAREVAEVWEALGDVRMRLGELEDAGRAYAGSRRRFGSDPLQQARLALKQAAVPWRLGRYPQTVRWVRRGLTLLEGHDGRESSAERARLYVLYATARHKQGRSLDAIEWCRRAIEDAQRAGARDALAHAYLILDWTYALLGRFDEAVHLDDALAIYEELGNLERQGGVLNNSGLIAYFQGRWSDALSFYERAGEAWEKAGDRWSAAFATQNRGVILADQGRLEEGEPLLRAALRVARASHSASRVADVASDLGRLLARAGRFDEARELLGEAFAIYEHDGERAGVLTATARTAELCVLEGKADEALALARSVLPQVEAVGGIYTLTPMLKRVQGIALMQAGSFDAARESLASSLVDARARRADAEVALTLDALVALGRAAGYPTGALDEERRAIFARLGIVKRPSLAAA